MLLGYRRLNTSVGRSCCNDGSTTACNFTGVAVRFLEMRRCFRRVLIVGTTTFLVCTVMLPFFRDTCAVFHIPSRFALPAPSASRCVSSHPIGDRDHNVGCRYPVHSVRIRSYVVVVLHCKVDRLATFQRCHIPVCNRHTDQFSGMRSFAV